MALKFSTDLKNSILNSCIVQNMCGTWGTAGSSSLSIYSGAQPATPDAATNGILLCTIPGVAWSAGTAGTCTLASSNYEAQAVATGTAGWCRFRRVGTNYLGSAGTFVIDADVGTSGKTFIINSSFTTAGKYVTLTNCKLCIP